MPAKFDLSAAVNFTARSELHDLYQNWAKVTARTAKMLDAMLPLDDTWLDGARASVAIARLTVAKMEAMLQQIEQNEVPPWRESSRSSVSDN